MHTNHASNGLLLRHFFFQAEDGIRDIGVTGVQTCALPISDSPSSFPPSMPAAKTRLTKAVHGRKAVVADLPRSEERRVGKECRSRWRTQQSERTTMRYARTIYD